MLQMEDEYDLEVEIERQLAQEEEEMAEMQENIANQKLVQQTAKVRVLQRIDIQHPGIANAGMLTCGMILNKNNDDIW